MEINLFKGIEIDKSYTKVLNVNNDATFLSYLKSVARVYETITDSFNFMWNTSSKASITFESSRNLSDFLNYNYLSYYDETRYYYFFIDSIKIDNQNVAKCDLTIDAWSTYGYRGLLVNNPYLYILRNHTKRFNSSTAIDISKASPIYNVEDIDSNIKDRFNNVSQISSLNTERWLVVQVIDNDSTKNITLVETDGGSYISLPIRTFIAPIIGRTLVLDGTTYSWNASDLYKIFNVDISWGKVVGTYVVRTPLSSLNGNTISSTSAFTLGAGYGRGKAEIKDSQLLVSIYNTPTRYLDSSSNSLSTFISGIFNFPTNVSATSLYLHKQEPKLLRFPYCSMSLNDLLSHGNEYNIFDIIGSSLSPSSVVSYGHYTQWGNGVVQDYFYFDTTNSIYAFNDTKTQSKGNNISQGISLPVVSDSYLNWLQNQSIATTTANATKSAMAIVGEIAGGLSLVAGVAMGQPMLAIGGATAMSSSIVSAIGSVASQQSAIDQAKNMDDSISASQNALYFLQAPNKDTYIEFKSLKTTDMYRVEDYFYYYGYAINDIRKFTELESRCMFNYVKTMDYSILSVIEESNEIKNTIYNILANGTEIWNINFLMTNTDGTTSIAECRGYYANYEKILIGG